MTHNKWFETSRNWFIGYFWLHVIDFLGFQTFKVIWHLSLCNRFKKNILVYLQRVEYIYYPCFHRRLNICKHIGMQVPGTEMHCDFSINWYQTVAKVGEKFATFSSRDVFFLWLFFLYALINRRLMAKGIHFDIRLTTARGAKETCRCPTNILPLVL